MMKTVEQLVRDIVEGTTSFRNTYYEYHGKVDGDDQYEDLLNLKEFKISVDAEY